jgi:hypothetical protein
MAQHDQTIANADGATVRADINSALAAIFSNSSGTTAPTTTTAYMYWADTTTGLLKQRNAANSAWIIVGVMGSANLANAAPRGTTRNLQARTNATTPNSKIDITADDVVVRDASTGHSMMLSNISVTIDITASAANGLDTGSEASATWYYGYVIAKADGTVAGLFSASATSPTLPSGYTYAMLATVVRNNSFSNFLAYRQRGNEVFYEARQNALSGGSSTTEATVSLAAFVPPIAHSFLFTDSASATNDGTGYLNINLSYRYVSGLDWHVQKRNVGGGGAGGGNNYFASSMIEMPNVSQQMLYNFDVFNGSSPSLNLFVNGFKLPVGGE